MKPTHRQSKFASFISWLFTFFTGVALAGTLIACGGDSADDGPAAAPVDAGQQRVMQDEVLSDKSRDDSPDVTAEELAELVNGNSAFAFDLYHALRENSDGNLFYSPHSISVALAMTYAGARGETERQMADTLHFLLPQDRLHPAFNSLDQELRSLTDLPQSEVEEGSQTGTAQGGFTLEFANAVWGQHDYMFLDTFLDVLARNYGAGVRPVDFKEQPEESRLIINEWVAEQTRNTIKDIVPPDVIKPRTRLVLANAIYFKANWRYRFDESLTRSLPFHLLSGEAIDTLMMTMEESEWFMYARGKGYQALELPYGDERISMAIILPDLGRFEEFESPLDARLAGQILEDMERTDVDLTMPKFEFESDLKLGDTLGAMGMPNAFEEKSSDFSGMDGRLCIAGDDPCLLISDVLHKAFVSVEEKGTEASAASVVVVERPVTRTARTPITVVVDRPFIFLIRDDQTGAILFLGRVLDPIR